MTAESSDGQIILKKYCVQKNVACQLTFLSCGADILLAVRRDHEIKEAQK